MIAQCRSTRNSLGTVNEPHALKTGAYINIKQLTTDSDGKTSSTLTRAPVKHFPNNPSRCIVPGCNGNYPSGPKVAVFPFPEDTGLRFKWMNTLTNYPFIPNQHSKICELHFSAKDVIRESFIYPSKSDTKLRLQLKQPLLRYGSVPTRFPNQVKESSTGVNAEPVKKFIPVERSDLIVTWPNKAQGQKLYFKGDYADDWKEFSCNTPVLSYLGRCSESQKAQQAIHLPSVVASTSSVDTSDASTGSTTIPAEDEDDEMNDPAALLVSGKTKQLMKLLQRYRETKRLQSTMLAQQQSSSETTEKETTRVSQEESISITTECSSSGDDLTSTSQPDHMEIECAEDSATIRTKNYQAISHDGREVKFYLYSKTVNIDGLTYIKFSSFQESVLKKYIMQARPRRAGKKEISMDDLCKLVYQFCQRHNVMRPTSWDVNQTADMEWLKGFLRRSQHHENEYNLFSSDEEDAENDFEGFEDPPNKTQATPSSAFNMNNDRMIQILGCRDHSYVECIGDHSYALQPT